MNRRRRLQSRIMRMRECLEPRIEFRFDDVDSTISGLSEEPTNETCLLHPQSVPGRGVRRKDDLRMFTEATTIANGRDAPSCSDPDPRVSMRE